jgi:hypothetical protein
MSAANHGCMGSAAKRGQQQNPVEMGTSLFRLFSNLWSSIILKNFPLTGNHKCP